MEQKTTFDKILVTHIKTYNPVQEYMEDFPTILLIPLTKEFIDYIEKARNKTLKVFSEDNGDCLMYPTSLSFLALGFCLLSTASKISQFLNCEEYIKDLEYQNKEDREDSFKIISLEGKYQSLANFYCDLNKKYSESDSLLFFPITQTKFIFTNSFSSSEIFLEINSSGEYNQDTLYFFSDSINTYDILELYKCFTSESINEF